MTLQIKQNQGKLNLKEKVSWIHHSTFTIKVNFWLKKTFLTHFRQIAPTYAKLILSWILQNSIICHLFILKFASILHGYYKKNQYYFQFLQKKSKILRQNLKFLPHFDCATFVLMRTSETSPFEIGITIFFLEHCDILWSPMIIQTNLSSF